MQQLDAQLSSLDVGLALRALGAVARRLADLHWAISAPHQPKGVTEHFRYTRLHDVFALLAPVELP